MPAIPPPITNTFLLRSKYFGYSSLFLYTFAADILIISKAFWVAFSRLSCIQESCSLMLAISKRYGFRPTDSTVLMKVVLCTRGEHEATITLVRLCSLIAFLICACPGSEQVYKLVCEKTTPGSLRTSCPTFFTSTV